MAGSPRAPMPMVPAPPNGSDENCNEIRPRRVYLPGDIDDDCAEEGCTSVNPCTLELQPLENSDFDYVRYEEMYYLKGLQVRAGRFRDERASIAKPITQHSEESLKELFVERYGIVDFEDPLMVKRLEVMKQTLLEREEPSLDEEEIVTRLLDETIEIDDGGLWIYEDPDDGYEAIITKIAHRFTMDEYASFESLWPADAGSDLFHLPRGDLSDICEEQVADYSTSEEPESAANLEQIPDQKKNRKISEAPLKHLHVYDPKFEYCFTPPYRILNTCEESGIEGLDIPRMAAFRILEHLNRFPNGITRQVFWATYYELHGRFLQFCGLSVFQVFDYLPGEVMIVPETGLYPELLFPGFLEGVVDPELIMRRIWHSIRCILSRKPYVMDRELMQLVENEFGIKFDPHHWGFPTVVAFLKWCLELFSAQNVFTILRVTFLQNRVTSTKDYFCLKVPSLLRKMEELAGATELGCKKLRRIPQDGLGNWCVGRDYKIPHLADFISEGEQYIMGLYYITGPYRMSFVPSRYREKAAEFKKSLQISWLYDPLDKFPRPKDSQLSPGMYVMARIKWPTLEWHRVRIIWYNPKTTEYYVFTIDAGFVWHVPLSNIRFMPLEYAQQVAYAIPVQLMLSRVTKESERRYSWERRIARNLIVDELVKNNLVQVEFWKSRTGHGMGCKMWSVTCTVLTNTIHERVDRDLPVLHMSLTITLYLKLKEVVEETIKREDAEKAAKLKDKEERRAARKAIMAAPINEPASNVTMPESQASGENKDGESSGILRGDSN